MKIKKATILSSELEFRNYVILNYRNISQIIIFEDILDKVIFFYCFTKNESMVATKESNNENFSNYCKTYKNLANKIHFSILDSENIPCSIILTKEEI